MDGILEIDCRFPIKSLFSLCWIQDDFGYIVISNWQPWNFRSINSKIFTYRTKYFVDRKPSPVETLKMPWGAFSPSAKSINLRKSPMSRKSRTASLQKHFFPSFSLDKMSATGQWLSVGHKCLPIEMKSQASLIAAKTLHRNAWIFHKQKGLQG